MKLSARKKEILAMVARGYTDKEISVELDISMRTVQTHISSIVSKLNARNRVNAVALYIHSNPGWKFYMR